MKYENIVEGKFINRINRFVANVFIDGVVEQVHVKNTGRCKELLIEGAKVYLEQNNNPNRKTKYSLINVYKDDLLINMDSQVPNAVVYEAVKNNKIPQLQDVKLLKREVTYKKSRFDLYYETETLKGFIEVKGVTLEKSGIAMFPDAPTERGRKHVYELIDGMQNGYTNYLFLLIQFKGAKKFIPNYEMDNKFALSLIQARSEGVSILCYDSVVTIDSIIVNEKIKVEL